MKRKYGWWAIIFFFGLSGRADGQVRVQLVPVASTDARIREIHGPHIALDDPSAASRHILVLMIEGTGASAVSCRRFDSCLATLGYQVVSIDYPNNVITTVCSKSSDSSCFDGFRQEILFGTPVSPLVDVDSTNCIVNRFTRLLTWLAANDKGGGWRDYLRAGKPRWDRIVVAGHSQGAGHAAYLGQTFRLAGVLMLSGPQDYLQVYRSPAPWESRKSQTPVSRYYAFLHVQDPFNYRYQVADVCALTGAALTDTTMVSPGAPVRSTRHILVNDLQTSDKHGSTLQTKFIQVWEYALKGMEAAK